MGTIATLSASIVMDVGDFSKGLTKARRDLKNFADFIPFANTNVSTFAAGLTAAGIAGLSYYTKQAMSSIDATAKLSDRLGVSTEKLIAFELAADLSGVGAEQFQAALDKLNKTGGGKTIEEVADEIAGITNPSQRASKAMEYFGKSGAKMVNVLQGGSAGLREAQAEAEKFGITVSRIDAAKVEAANDSFTRLGALLKGVGTQLAVQIAPYLEAGIKKLIEMGTSGSTMGEKVTNAFNFVLEGIATGLDYLELFKAGWYGLQAVVSVAIAGILTPVEILAKTIDGLLDLVGMDTGAGAAFGEMTEGLGIEAKKSLALSEKALVNFHLGTNQKAAKVFFKDIQDGAQKSAEAIANAAAEKNELIDQAERDFQELLKNDKGGDAFSRMAESLVKDAAGAIDDNAKKKTEVGQFKQIDLGLTSVTGLQRMGKQKTEVYSSQTEVTNRLLAEIKTRIAISSSMNTEPVFGE